MFSCCSYENDPDLFMFDYRKDLLTRATERERVFTLNKFVEPEDDNEKAIEEMENKRRGTKLIKDIDEDAENLVTAKMQASMKSSGKIGAADNVVGDKG